MKVIVHTMDGHSYTLRDVYSVERSDFDIRIKRQSNKNFAYSCDNYDADIVDFIMVYPHD